MIAFWISGDEGQKVLLLLVPTFETTGTFVLVNLKDLSYHSRVIQSDL